MPASHPPATKAALDKLLAEHGFTPGTRLYREMMRDQLTPTGAPGIFIVQANPAPSEAVIDVYGQGYLVQAEQVGPGLAFAESDSPNWQETMELRALRTGSDAASMDKLEVEVLVQDVLRQGGLLYPVESVTVERAWYCTLPHGSINVREVS